jgi:hypothetical protein
MNSFLLILMSFSFFSCSFKNNPLRNQKSEGHFNLYSKPQIDSREESPQEIRLVIAATSGLSNNDSTQYFHFEDRHHSGKQEIAIGGLDVIQQYFNILREEYKNILLIDSGNILSPDTPSVFDKLKYDAITLGINDFNYKLSKRNSSTELELKNFIKRSKTPVLLSNLIDLKKGIKVEWQGSKSHLLKSIQGINVGIIGVLPDELTKVTPIQNRVGLIVQDMLQATLSEARLLRSLGADVIILLTNQSLECGKSQSMKENLPLNKVNFEPHQSNACDLSSTPLGVFLQRLPHQLIDVVVTGRNKTKVANFINSTLVIGGFEDPQSMIYAELFFDKTTKSLRPEKSILHQPVTFCRYFFKETQDCFFEDQSINHKNKSPALFLGKEIINSQDPISRKKILNNKVDFQLTLNKLSGDIIVKPRIPSYSQLTSLNVSGHLLLEILEEEYNLNHHHKWYPLEFRVESDYLKIYLNKKLIKKDMTYKVIGDIETFNQLRDLKALRESYHDTSLAHLAWVDFLSISEDKISSRLSSSKKLPTDSN